MTDKIVVLTTADSQELAQKIARELVEKKLAACVTILPGATSVYRWQEKVEQAEELVLVIKSRRDLFDQISAEIRGLHTYEVPECVALPIVDGSSDYLAWLQKELR